MLDSPLLLADRPWEGERVFPCGRIAFDADQGEFKMWVLGRLGPGLESHLPGLERQGALVPRVASDRLEAVLARPVKHYQGSPHHTDAPLINDPTNAPHVLESDPLLILTSSPERDRRDPAGISFQQDMWNECGGV